MFKVTGISTFNGKTKVRYANDIVSRVKMLNKGGHTNIRLAELPNALSKGDCVKHLKQNAELMANPVFAEAINAADEKYNGSTTVKVSLEALKARAESVQSTVETTAELAE